MSHKISLTPFTVLASQLSQLIVESAPSSIVEIKKLVPSSGRPCKYCPDVDLESNEEFRKHYQTDWHNKNQELALKGKKPLSLEDFELLAAMESSSDDSDFWQENSEEDGLNLDDEDEEVKAVNPMIVFCIDDSRYGIYRRLFFSNKADYKSNSATAEMVRAFLDTACKSTWAIFLIKSGRLFAGIFDISKGKFSKTKVMKKYTERRKQGGSQLLRDKSGKVGRSAGSQLRRKNETDLLCDIEQLICEWKSDLDKCQLIWWNKTFFSQLALFQGKALAKNDSRLRLIPFTTFKACEEEALRCLNLLTSAHNVKHS